VSHAAAPRRRAQRCILLALVYEALSY
jgi:hypothetical protein